MKVRELAQRAGVTVKTLYHYERLGLLRPARTAARYRSYTTADLRTMRRIQALRFLGFTLRQIRTLLRIGAKGMLEAVEAQRRAVERKRLQLARAAAVLEQAEGAMRRGEFDDPLAALTGRAGWALNELKYGEGNIVQRPPDRVSETKRRLFHQVAALLGADPASAEVQAAVAEWRAMIAAELGDDPAIRAALARASKRRHTWPDGVKEWVASLYETDTETWTRVADLIDRATAPDDATP